MPFQCFCQLIGAGGAFAPTIDTFKSMNGFGGFHAFNKCSDSLCVAVAAALENDLSDDSLLEPDVDLLRAGARANMRNGLHHDIG